VNAVFPSRLPNPKETPVVASKCTKVHARKFSDNVRAVFSFVHIEIISNMPYYNVSSWTYKCVLCISI